MPLDVTNEVLAAKLDVVIQRLDKQDVRFDAMATKFISIDIFDLRIKELANGITTNTISISQLQNKRVLQTWLLGTLSAIAGAILTVLILSFLDKLKG